MLTTRMYKAVKEERKNKKIKEQKRKAMKVTTLTAVGIGAVLGATMMYKKNKSKANEDNYEYMYNLQSYNNEDENYELKQKNEYENCELQEKIEEFNSNRLSYENEKHPSNEDMNKFINKTDLS